MSEQTKEEEATNIDLDHLNPEQQQAVEHDRGPMLVVAGAGTGKTRVITERIGWLIDTGRVEPEEILALTFTEKAAGEMLDRLDALIGWQAYRVDVLTFHAFGARLLSRFGHHLGIPTHGEVIPETSQLVLLKRHLDEAELTYYGAQDNIIDFLSMQLDFIHSLQNADVTPEDFQGYIDDLSEANTHKLDIAEAKDQLKLYKLYEELKRRYQVIDHYDQLKLPLQILQERPNLAQRLADQYQYVLVDEYQDTNAAQDALLKQFTPQDGNIFAVGDDDQAIYGFRGAQLSNILEFNDYYQVEEPAVLTRNYRSTQAILDAAYQLIRNNNPHRLEHELKIDKQLVSNLEGNNQPVKFLPFPTREAELNGVAEQITESLEAGQDPSEIAILATSHRILNRCASVLRGAGIPHSLSSSANIFQQPEILQLWHLLRWLVLEAEDEAIIQLLSGPFVGWEHAQVRRVAEAASQELVTIEEAVEQLAETDDQAEDLVEKLSQWRQWATQLPVSQLAYQLVFETGVKDDWIEQVEDTPRMIRVFEDLQLWLRHMQQYEYAALDATLHGYLGMFPKPPEIMAEEVVGEEHGVNLLTVHGAKGLEFETVFIINNTRQAWSPQAPFNRLEVPEELQNDLGLPPEHEQRRLLYVAMTRAKRELYLSAVVQTKSGNPRKPAPFMEEIFTEEELQLASYSTPESLDESLQNLHRFAPKTQKWQSEKLPFESGDGWLQLSTSDINSYSFCPYEFYLAKVLKIQTPLGPQVKFGQILHQLFHEYYRSRQLGEPVELEELKERLNERWDERGYQTKQEAEAALGRAEATLEQFYKREEKAERSLRSTEEDFRLKLPEAKLKLTGRIDVTFSEGEDIEIRDFKTSPKRGEQDKLNRKAKRNLQLRTYALAIQETAGVKPARVVLDYVVSNQQGVAELSDRILSNHRQKLADIAEDIRSHNFQPNSSPAHECAAHRYWGKEE